MSDQFDPNTAEPSPPLSFSTILATYPWVDEFKPEDSDEKYRDGVRYVLLCIEYNSGGGIAIATEDIKAKWGFS